MVKVYFAYVRHLLRSALLIKAIEWNKRALIVVSDTNTFKNFLRNGGFSGCCTACNSYENGLSNLGLGDHASNLDVRALNEKRWS